MEISQNGLKRKYVYMAMTAIVLLVALLFYFLWKQGLINSTVNSFTKNSSIKYTRSVYSNTDHLMEKPMDIYSDGQSIFVTDAKANQVLVFDESSGNFKYVFGEKGIGPGKFNSPFGITADSSGNIYVADLQNNNISIFTKDGKFVKFFAVQNSLDRIQGPTAIRIVNNKLYVPEVSNTLSKRDSDIKVFDLNGKLLLKLICPKDSFYSVEDPNGIAVDTAGNIYVSDTNRSRVVKYDKNGNFLKAINGVNENKQTSIISSPRGIAVTKDGTIYVVDSLGNEVFAFNQNGKLKETIGGPGTEGGQFYLPSGLYLDPNGTFFVTDRLNKRIQMFK